MDFLVNILVGLMNNLHYKYSGGYFLTKNFMLKYLTCFNFY
jgi:hypothetical protein